MILVSTFPSNLGQVAVRSMTIPTKTPFLMLKNVAKVYVLSIVIVLVNSQQVLKQTQTSSRKAVLECDSVRPDNIVS